MTIRDEAEKFCKKSGYFGLQLTISERAYLAAFEGPTVQALVAVLELFLKYAPNDGDKFACWSCDMGGAGWSSKGDGYHDDKEPNVCPVVKARSALQKFQEARNE